MRLRRYPELYWDEEEDPCGSRIEDDKEDRYAALLKSKMWLIIKILLGIPAIHQLGIFTDYDKDSFRALYRVSQIPHPTPPLKNYLKWKVGMIIFNIKKL